MKIKLNFLVLLALLVMFSACDPNDKFDYGTEDYYSTAWICNNTPDTLAVLYHTTSASHPTDIRVLLPFDTIMYYHSSWCEDPMGRPYSSYWEIMRDHYDLEPFRIYITGNHMGFTCENTHFGVY